VTRSAHARYRGQTLEQRVWRFLRENGTTKMRDVADAFEISRDSAGTALRRLCNKGSATVEGGTCNVRYTATDQKPEDMRGLAPGSVKVFVKVAKDRRNPNKRRYHPTYEPTHALERAIGLKRNRRVYD